jgi:hypothetical protein
MVRAIWLTSRLVFQVERRPIVESTSHIAHGQPRGLRPWSLGSFKQAIWRSSVEGRGSRVSVVEGWRCSGSVRRGATGMFREEGRGDGGRVGG